LLVEALNDKVVVTIDGERREITKREAVATQLVNKSTGADLGATKMLIDALKDAEKKAGVAQPPEPAPFTAADEEVMAAFIARLPAILGGGTSMIPIRRRYRQPISSARPVTLPVVPGGS